MFPSNGKSRLLLLCPVSICGTDGATFKCLLKILSAAMAYPIAVIFVVVCICISAIRTSISVKSSQ